MMLVNVGTTAAVGVTLSVTALLVPLAVVTLTKKLVAVEEAGTGKFTFRLVELPAATVPAMVVPLKFTVVAPATKPVPVKVTVVVWPAGTGLGAMDVNVGAATALGVTLRVTALLVPPAVVTLTG